MIPLDHLEAILEEAFDFSPPLFNYIILILILSLTLGLRPSEMRRLLKDTSKYLMMKKNQLDKLDYQNGLIRKTGQRLDPKKLKCPSVSLIGRILLKYNHPFASVETVESFFDPEKHFRSGDDLSEYVERSLRTTAGHHIIYCMNVENREHNATIFTVKDRMAHQDTSMATKVYAKNLPSDILPESYFGCAGIDKNGEMITAHFPLWDAYLLKKWLDKMMSVKTEIEINIIWNQILTEWSEIKILNKPHESVLKPTKY